MQASKSRRSVSQYARVVHAASYVAEALERRTLLSFSVSFPLAPTLVQRGDVNASKSAGEESEAAVVVNPTNPRNVVAFGNDIGGGANDKAWYSFDGGLTYAQSSILNPAGQTGVGDPAAAFDRAGNLYYVHLTSPGLSVSIAKSTNGGQTWSLATVAATTNTDKCWITVGPNPSNLSQDIVYVLYRKDVTEGANNDAQIHSVRSLDGGATFVNDVIINDDSNTGFDFSTFARPVVRQSDGRLYVVWDDETNRPSFSEIKIDYSSDGGVTWNADQSIGTTIVTRSNPVRWEIPAQSDREILTVPSLAVAQTGPFAGRLFVAYTISPLGQPNSDIRVAWSSNPTGAAGTWNNTVANDVTTNSQFHPWVDTDPMTGIPYVGWLDCRNSGTNTKAERFGTASIDGGVTWLANVKIADAASDQSAGNVNRDAGNNFGDYNANWAFGGMAFDAWPDNTNSTGNNPGGTADLDIYTDRTVLTGHVITVTGTAAADTYYVQMDASGTFLQIYENTSPVGTPSFTMLEDSIDGIIFNLGGGADTVNVYRLDASMPMTINGEAGNDIVNFGSTGNLVSTIQSPVTVNGGADADTVNFNDQGNTNDDTYSITSASVTTDNSATVSLGTVESLFVNGGTGSSDINVFSTAATMAVSLNSGPGNDSNNINETDPASPAIILPNTGDDAVFINLDNTGNAEARFNQTQRVGPATIGSGGLLTLGPATGTVLTMTSLSITGTGRMDMRDDAAIIDYTGSSPIATVQSLLTSGYASGAWNGNGIMSQTAAATPNTAVGFGEATDLFNSFPAPFAGQSVDSTAVLLRYTLNGDANLDKSVDTVDFNLLASNFSKSPRRWSQGDFNFDQTVDTVDFNLQANRFSQTLPAPAAAPASRFGAIPIAGGTTDDDLVT